MHIILRHDFLRTTLKSCMWNVVTQYPTHQNQQIDLATIPLTIWINFLNALVHYISDQSQWNLAHVTTVTLSWRVQNFIVFGWARFKPEHSKFCSNLEFNLNPVSGTGAWIRHPFNTVMSDQLVIDIAKRVFAIRVWRCNHISCFQCNVINLPCTITTWKLEHG